jgi:hypothetical protein
MNTIEFNSDVIHIAQMQKQDSRKSEVNKTNWNVNMTFTIAPAEALEQSFHHEMEHKQKLVPPHHAHKSSSRKCQLAAIQKWSKKNTLCKCKEVLS